MKTNIYIDGLNLYYRLLKPSPGLKWLNLKLLAEQVLKPANTVQIVRYYTARISGRVDPTAPARQQIYLDALATVPEVTVHMGNFLSGRKWAGITHPPQTRPPVAIPPPWPDVVRIWRDEEKGSDVNLASHLIRDAFRSDFEVAAVLTNDTDLVEPIRIVAHEIGRPVGLLCPVPKPAESLRSVASFVRHVRPQHLQAAQFPDSLPDTAIRKPSGWA